MMPFNPVFTRLPTTIFTVMSMLAAEHKAVNLGQGFPDNDGPDSLRAVAGRALAAGPNQYAPMPGMPALRQAVAAHARRFYGLDYDPEGEVLITSGATEALAAAILALVPRDGEIVLVEPSYDAYRPLAEAAGLTVRSLALSPPDWRLTEGALRAAITPATRAILINSPLNPVSRVFDREELGALARLLAERDILAICDEVYEHLTFDGRPHIPLATLPEMRERVVRIGSAGKIFSLTGWKVGWVQGPRALVEVIGRAHQFLTFATPPALQLGVAHGLEQAMDFPETLRAGLQANRDILAAGLAEIGFEVLPAEGTYFLTARIDGLLKKEDGANERDRAFCERLVREAGVALIPLSAFFSTGTPDIYVRFAFCKRRETIEEALKRLRAYFRHG